MSRERVEAFSDAVLAIIITLLVLELHVPELADHSSLAQYSAAMAPLIPKIVSFALTFVMICVHWVAHHFFFQHLRRATIGLVWLNNLFLLLICFYPFPTAMLGDHPTDQFPVLLYGANSLLLALTFFGLRSYAAQAKLVEDDSPTDVLGPRHSIPGIALYTLSILASFVNTTISLVCFFVVPLLYFWPTLIRASSMRRSSSSSRAD